MVNLTTIPPKLLKNFLNKFNDQFTKPAFLSFCIYINGLFLKHKRASIFTIASETIDSNYENLQYFISEAKWNPEEVNDCRIEILQKNRTTKSTSKGALVLDD